MHARARRLASPLVVGALALAGAVAVHLRDPRVEGSWGVCPVQLLTGLDCPGCGGLRAVHHLTHLDVVAAASSHLLLVVGLPVAVAGWGWWLVARWRGGGTMRLPVPPTWVWVGALVVLGAFTVARNLPGSWLAA